MAKKPNYTFEKRQKEAAKQKKVAEKRERKRQKKEEDGTDASPDQGTEAPADTPK